MDLKELKRLAAACRKAGILHFKSEQYEFTLTEEAPKSPYKVTKESKKAPNTVSNQSFESDSLTNEELLFWSVGTPEEILGTEGES